MKKVLAASCVILLTGIASAPAFGQGTVGMDQNGNQVCELGEMGIPNAVQGQQYSIDLIISSPSPLVSLGVIFGTPDLSAISNMSFVYSSPAAWTDNPFTTSVSLEQTPGFQAYLTANGGAWKAVTTDFTFSSPFSQGVIGTLTFTSEIDGCISLGIDPGDGGTLGSALLDQSFLLVPFDACQPNDCGATTATERVSWSDTKELFR